MSFQLPLNFVNAIKIAKIIMLIKTLSFFTIFVLMGFTWFKYDNLDAGIKPYPRLSDTTRIKIDLTTITQTERPRNYRNTAILDTVAAYIQSEFLKETPSVSEQSAVMITNTAFYRNKNYHETGDTMDKLNIGNIGLVVDGVFRSLMKL